MVNQSMFKVLQVILIVLLLLSCAPRSLSSNCPKVEEFPVESICYLGDNKTKVQITQEVEDEVFISYQCLQRKIKMSELYDCPTAQGKVVSSKRGSIKLYVTIELEKEIGNLEFFKSAKVLLTGSSPNSESDLCLLKTEFNLLGWVDCMKIQLGENEPEEIIVCD
jgi:hypothetical protein